MCKCLLPFENSGENSEILQYIVQGAQKTACFFYTSNNRTWTKKDRIHPKIRTFSHVCAILRAPHNGTEAGKSVPFPLRNGKDRTPLSSSRLAESMRDFRRTLFPLSLKNGTANHCALFPAPLTSGHCRPPHALPPRSKQNLPPRVRSEAVREAAFSSIYRKDGRKAYFSS